jgi:hypothetical protein
MFDLPLAGKNFGQSIFDALETPIRQNQVPAEVRMPSVR